MKKIICFDPPYSLYFNDLALSLDKLLGGRTEKECISFNYANKLYLNNFKQVILQPVSLLNIKYSDYDFVNKIRSLSNVNGVVSSREHEKANIRAYLSIKNYIERNLDATYFIYNDLRWNHAFAIDILKKNRCKYFVFERGVFRPHSTTMDRQGVNANSKFRLMQTLDFSRSEAKELDALFFKVRTERRVKLRFISYLLISKLLSFLTPSYFRIASKSIYKKSFREYISLQWLLIKSKFSIQNQYEEYDIPYVFVPLQLSNDTQTIINSDFSSTQEFIDKIVNDYRHSKLYKNMKLVFKKHPLDVSNYQFPEDVCVSQENTTKLIDKCEFCITINSTVGFEAQFKKRVLCLGSSFYTEHGCVTFINKNENAFEASFTSSFTEHYKYFALKHYQVPGSIFNYTESDLYYTANKIIASH